MFYVYKITNTINGQIYVGKTSNPQRRWTRHKSDASNSDLAPKLYRSMRKYGKENFTFEVIESFELEHNAYEAEVKLIEQMDSIKNGLNVAAGGIGFSSGENNPNYGKPMKQHVKQALLEANLGKTLSDEHKNNISKNNKRTRLGRVWSEESKLKSSLSHEGKYVGEKNPSSKLTQQNVDEIRVMLENKTPHREIAKIYNVSKSAITLISSGKTWTKI